jgi:hypothetical protein
VTSQGLKKMGALAPSSFNYKRVNAKPYFKTTLMERSVITYLICALVSDIIVKLNNVKDYRSFEGNGEAGLGAGQRNLDIASKVLGKLWLLICLPKELVGGLSLILKYTGSNCRCDTTS